MRFEFFDLFQNGVEKTLIERNFARVRARECRRQKRFLEIGGREPVGFVGDFVGQTVAVKVGRKFLGQTRTLKQVLAKRAAFVAFGQAQDEKRGRNARDV